MVVNITITGLTGGRLRGEDLWLFGAMRRGTAVSRHRNDRPGERFLDDFGVCSRTLMIGEMVREEMEHV